MATKTLQPPVKKILPLSPPPTDFDVPQSFLIDHVSPSLQVDWPAICGSLPGDFDVPLDPVTKASFLDVTQFRRINVRVSGTKAEVRLHVGLWSPTTACEEFVVPVDGHIHSYEVTGPQIHLCMHGNRTLGVERVHAWVYLRS